MSFRVNTNRVQKYKNFCRYAYFNGVFCNKIGFLYNFVRKITKGFKFMVHRLTGLTKLLTLKNSFNSFSS